MHCEISGVGDLEVEDDRACIAAIKTYLSYFPSNNTERPPVVTTDDPADRRDPELLELVPDNPRRAYDVKRIVRGVVDRDSFFEIKPAPTSSSARRSRPPRTRRRSAHGAWPNSAS